MSRYEWMSKYEWLSSKDDLLHLLSMYYFTVIYVPINFLFSLSSPVIKLLPWCKLHFQQCGFALILFFCLLNQTSAYVIY